MRHKDISFSVTMVGAYTPNQPDVYSTALCAAICGMALHGKSQPTDPTAGDYASFAAVAQAFAQQLDTQWNTSGFTTPTTAEIDTIRMASYAAFADKGTILSAPYTTAITWATQASAVIAVAKAVTANYASQGVVSPGYSSSAGTFVFYGGGADGTVTFDGVTAVTGWTLSGGNYTANRDTAFVTATVNNTVTLFPSNFQMFASLGYIINVGGVVANDGGNGANGSGGTGGAGGTTTAAHTLQSGANGGAGASGAAAGTNGTGVTGIGGPGTAGGAATNAGGTGGTITALTANQGGYGYGMSAILGSTGTANTTSNGGASGGGGGGATAATSSGGGGGAGGGTIKINAPSITNNGAIHARGGNGGNGGGTTASGGGGIGGGGLILLTTRTGTVLGAGTIDANAGTAGTGSNGGANGIAGTAANNGTIQKMAA